MSNFEAMSPPLHPNENIEASLDGIRGHLMDGAPALAEAAARRHLKSHPGSFRLEKALSVSLMMQGKFGASLDLLQRLHAAAPEDTDVAVNLAKAHLELKQHEDAEALLADMVGLDAASLLSRSLIERRQLDVASPSWIRRSPILARTRNC